MNAKAALPVPTLLILISSLFFISFALLPTTASAQKDTPKSSNSSPNTCSFTPPPPASRKATTETTTTMRAWTCHGRTQKEMVDKLMSANIVSSPQVRDALYRVDRGNYVAQRSGAYNDSPQPIGYGQTISAPHMHAHVLEEMLPSLVRASKENPNDELRILDVGSGSGYLTAVFGRMVDKGEKGPIPPLVKGKVWGIDVWPELIDFAKTNIKKQDKDLFDSDTVQVELGDGWKGLPDAAPFNAIHVGAAAETFPQNLMMQLAVGGVLVVPVGPDGGYQNLYKIEKVKDSPTFHSEDFRIRQLLGVRYVPLVHP